MLDNFGPGPSPLATVNRVRTSAAPEDDALIQWEAISRRVHSTQQRLLAPIEQSGVPGQWFAVMHQLLHAAQRRMPMTKLADDLYMSSGGFTKLANRMGQRGLIDRRSSAGDRRVVYAGLTAAGLRLARQLEQLYEDALREHVIEVLTPPTLARIAAESAPLDRGLDDGNGGGNGDGDGGGPVPRDPALPDRRRA